MRIRHLWLVIAVLLMPSVAAAHDHIADAFFGFCVEKASALSGFQFSWGQTITNSPQKNLSLVGDVNFNAGEHEDIDVKRFTYLAGIRVTVAGEKLHRVIPSLHFLAGAVHDNAGPQEGTEPAVTIGGAIDYLPHGDQAVSGWGARFQLEYVLNGGENFPKFSVGAVYRFR